ncbi:MAG TPA: hypothetical protein VJ804_03280, partial [Acidimicrobiales bacterium]|nr:hypothetical protein [Acidimicrobiales bacterium]
AGRPRAGAVAVQRLRRPARPSLGSAVGLCLAAIAMAIGLQSLSDNSFFTHLATGRVIVDTGHIPRSDIYTFTAQGTDWVVQSWLASALYGAVDDLAGSDGVRLLMGLLTAGVFLVVWRLTKPAKGLIVRVAIAAVCLGIGASQWSQRPLLFGLLFLGLTVLAAQGAFDPRWLVPVGWLWVNTHGSFPLGLVYLVVVLVGRRLDRDLSEVESRCLRWLLVGVLLGAVNPLGPELLLFPVELLQKQDVLRHVIEWQAPAFRSVGERLFLLEALVAVVALVRRPRYRHGLVLGVFLAAALLGSRNITVASIVLVPLLADAWADVGGIRSDVRDRMASLVGAVGVVAVLGVTVVQLGEPGYSIEGYPTMALDHLEDHHVELAEVRLAAPDVVGNLLELRDGPGRRVFYDDRFDMFPERLTDDVLDLVRGRPEARAALARHRIDLVLWERDQPLATILGGDPEWRLLFDEDDDWVLLCRIGANIGGDLGSC